MSEQRAFQWCELRKYIFEWLHGVLESEAFLHSSVDSLLGPQTFCRFAGFVRKDLCSMDENNKREAQNDS